MSLFSSLGSLFGAGSKSTINPMRLEDNSRHIMLQCAAFLEKAPRRMIRIESELPYPKDVMVKAFLNEIMNLEMAILGCLAKHKVREQENLEIIREVFVQLLSYQPIDASDLEIIQSINAKITLRPDLLEIVKANPRMREGVKVGLRYFVKYFNRAQEEANHIYRSNNQTMDLNFLTSAYKQIITMTQADIERIEQMR